MTQTQFTLYVTDPTRLTPLVRFSGIEYETLREASQAIAGQYGYKIAAAVLGRAFVMTAGAARVFTEQGIPFTLGFSNGESFTTLPGNVTGPTEHIRWAADEELNVAQ